MAIVFPASPSNNDTFTVGSITYTYDGSKWIGLGVTPTDRLIEGSNSLEITAGNELLWTGGKVGVNQVTPIAIFHAKSGANDGSLVSTFEGATNNKLNIRFDTFGPVLDVTAGDPLAFEIGGSEKMRLDGSGRLLKSGQAALTSTSQTHPIQVAADSQAQNIVCYGRAADDISAISFYEADGTTNLGEIQYRQDHLNFRHRVGDIRFASGGTAETLRIDGSGRIAQGERTPTNHGSPNLLLWGTDPTMMLASTGSTNNSSSVGIKFTVAGGSTGDYSKAGIFVQRQDSYNDLDMIFAFRSTNDADGVAISDEKLRITSDGNVGIGNSRSAYPIDLQSTTSPLTLNLKLNKSSTTGDYAEIAFQLWSGAGAGLNTFGNANETSRPSVVLRAINENTNSAGGSFVIGSFPGGNDNSSLKERFRITSKGEIQTGNYQGSNNILRQIARGTGNTSETFTSTNMGMGDNNTALINISLGGTGSLQHWGGCLLYWHMPRGGNSVIHQTIVPAYAGSGISTFNVTVSGNSLVVNKDSDVGVFVTIIGGGGQNIF